MAAKWVAVVVLFCFGGLVPLACSGEPYTAECGASGNCSGGTSVVTDPTLPDCSEGPCKCADPKLLACCPFGWQSCAADLVKCRPMADCGYEGIPCETDDDCPGPPDHRCGEGRCEGGVCELDIREWEPIPNQYPGDCKITLCSPEGTLQVVTDYSDLPEDANPCTYDTCEGDQPVNAILPDSSICPGDEGGACLDGKCYRCLEEFGAGVCPTGLACDNRWCVPPYCYNLVQDGQETDFGCGGPDCAKCAPERECLVGSDCGHNVCTSGICQPPTTTDGVMNGQETGVDCGYPNGPPCKIGEGCVSPIYCPSHICYKGVCQPPSCLDSIKNGTETGPDCGGECPPCP